MWLIPPSLQLPVFAVVVAIGAIFVRRKVGWGWLIVVWLGLSVLATTLYVIWVYRVSPLSPDETRMYAWTVARIFFPLLLVVSGMVVWLVALIVQPRPAPEDASSTEAVGSLEDMHELLSLPRQYRALLVAHREARQQAVGRPWYHVMFRSMFRPYVPSYVRQDFGSTLDLWHAPDVFKKDFIAAAPVLIALSEMPTARLSALEAYHRVNLKRLRRRLAPIRVIFGALFAVSVAASRLLPNVRPDVAKWDAARASALAFVTQPEHSGLMGVLVGLVLGFIAGAIMVWAMQRRVEALGDLLTVALAHRRVEAFGDTDTRAASPDDRVA